MSEPIYEPGPVAAPVSYQSSGTEPIVPLTCYAEYDGTLAAGSYVPTLIFRSQAGHVFMKAIADSTLAAGVSAAVSWFPGVKAAAAAATALDLPWGYCRAAFTNLASANTTTQIDFNPAVVSGVGFTSGSPDITFGNNGTGRYSLILNTTGFYLMCSAATFNIFAAPAAGSEALLSSQWLTGQTVAGSNIQSFLNIQASGTYTAVCGRATVADVDNTNIHIPKSGNTTIQQNSGQLASGNAWQFACKLSSVFVTSPM